jgi:RimJ/RimL family protein N-acetyltransferase
MAGDSVAIRFYEPGDAEALFAAARESVADVYPWLAWCHPDYALVEAEEWTERQPALRAGGEEYNFVITDAAGRFLGGCGLNQLNALHRTANLGYWVRSSAAGRGAAPAAVVALARWAFASTALERLEIVAAVTNVRSQRVAEKAGALREGVLRRRLHMHGVSHDAVVYSLVRADAPAGPKSTRAPISR